METTINRRKKPISYSLDPDLIRQLDTWIGKQDIQPSRTAALEQAIREFLERRRG